MLVKEHYYLDVIKEHYYLDVSEGTLLPGC